MFNMRRLFLATLVLLGLTISFTTTQSNASQHFTCNHGQDKVERAGIILVKKYGNNLRDYCVLVGEDRSHKYWNFPAGGCDYHLDKDAKGRRFTTYTAARETFEETGSMVAINPKKLAGKPFIYSPRHKIQLFVWRDDKLKARSLTQACQACAHNHKLPHSRREVLQYRAIPIIDLLAAANGIHNAGYPKEAQNPGLYTVYSRNGHATRLQGNYLRAIASDRAKLRAILSQICGVQF
jgi:hypothetical protein